MSTSELALSAPQVGVTSLPLQRWRLPLLCVCLLLAIGYNIFLALISPAPEMLAQSTMFVWFWLISFVPYLVASIVILATRGSIGRKYWIELAIILVGALVLRGQLVFLQPSLSRDSWRYLWDARGNLEWL